MSTYTRMLAAAAACVMLVACGTTNPPGFLGPLGQWERDVAFSPTPWSPAAEAGNVAGDYFDRPSGVWRHRSPEWTPR